MTLLLTTVNQFGIAMAADSMLTQKAQSFSGISVTRFLTDAPKIIPIPHLRAAVSMWGAAENLYQDGRVFDTDCWLQEIIDLTAGIGSVSEFAKLLRDRLEAARKSDDSDIGFQVSGYDNGNPCVFHVRNDSDARKCGRTLCTLDIPPGKTGMLRNGDFQTFGLIFDRAWPAVMDALAVGKELPHPSLRGWLIFQMSWIRFIADLYKGGGIPQVIGGPIHGLSIAPNGSVAEYRDYEMIAQYSLPK